MKIVNMEGFSDTIPQDCKKFIGKTLNFMGNKLIEIMKNKRDVFDDKNRQNMFSSQIRCILMSKEEVLEALTQSL